MVDTTLPMQGNEINEAFLAATPLIAKTIADLSYQMPSWYAEQYELEEFPKGNGSIAEQLVFRGAYPPIERGFQGWKKVANTSGCSPCDGPDSSYNWTNMGGHAMERKRVELMTRDYRSPWYAVREIQTTADFETVMGKVVENLFRQIRFVKEFNIGQNYFTGLAKKFVIDGNGAQPNTLNPYVYRPIAAAGSSNIARLSTINIMALEFIYEQMRRIPECVPYDVINGSPIFALTASHQLLAHLYRDDPNMRQDVRFSGEAQAMLARYNFTSVIRGMFIPAPILYPRRFNWSTTLGDFVEVAPLINGIPGEVGAYSGLNPDFENATYEEVVLHGKYPFKIYHLPTATTLGSNTSFGPEYSFMDNWQWINPQTNEDPARRAGYFMTSATIGLCPQFSEGIFAILFERPTKRTMFVPIIEGVCSATAIPNCTNVVPHVGCPCPLITDIAPHPYTAGTYFITFATPTGALVNGIVQLGLDNGAYISVTVTGVSPDSTVLQVTSAVNLTKCTGITTVYCDATLGCYSDVSSAAQSRSDETNHIVLQLKNPIKAITAGQVISALMGDGTTQNLAVVSVDLANSLWTVTYAAGSGPTDSPTIGAGSPYSAQMLTDRHGILNVCVPVTTDASCSTCGTPTVSYCIS